MTPDKPQNKHISSSSLLACESSISLFVANMQLIRSGMEIASRSHSVLLERDMRVMELGLRCLWGMCGGAMAFDDDNESFALWAPRAGEGWAKLSRHLGEAVETANAYVDTVGPMGREEYKLDQSIEAHVQRRYDERQRQRQREAQG